MFPKAVRSSLSQEEELRRSKEEQERKEEEEYLRLKESFVIEDQGEAEELSEQELRLLYFLCITSHLMLMCFSVSQPAAGVHPVCAGNTRVQNKAAPLISPLSATAELVLYHVMV